MKVKNGRVVQQKEDDLGDEKKTQIKGGEYNIAGVLGEINYYLAIASAAYYRQTRLLILDERNRTPLSRKQEQDDYGETMFEERDYAQLLAEDFRLRLSCAANGVWHCRDMMIELVDSKVVDSEEPSLRLGFWTQLADLFARWERCAQRCHFDDAYITALPSERQVIEIIGEIETLNSIVQDFCREQELPLDHFRL